MSPPETIPPGKETPIPEILTPEIIDETEGGILPFEDDEPPPEDLPDDGNLPNYALVEESVAFINRTIAEMVKTVFLRIGDHLLTRYFNDSVELACSKNRYKNRSYTELCRRPELSVTRQQLGVMIPIAAQERYFRITDS